MGGEATSFVFCASSLLGSYLRGCEASDKWVTFHIDFPQGRGGKKPRRIESGIYNELSLLHLTILLNGHWINVHCLCCVEEKAAKTLPAVSIGY